MPKRWMITDRNVDKNGLGATRSRAAEPLTYWISDGGRIDDWSSWRSVSAAAFQKLLAAAADKLPSIPDPARHEQQGHVGLFVHGYNNDWKDAARRYEQIARDLFDGPQGLGLCVLFNWPSNGRPTDYLADRRDARRCADDLGEVLTSLYDWMRQKELDAAASPERACRAKTSVIAHSMGSYVLQLAMQQAWTRANRPLLTSLVNQCLMVAADVDNDIFGSGEATGSGDGEGLANLCYRITAFYTGRDTVLGVSAGLKHFGKRRLGRSGLDRRLPCPDNVWDVDCSALIPKNASNVHSAHFDAAAVQRLMRAVLRGQDRGVLRAIGLAP